MYARSLALRMLPLLVGILTACSGSDVTGPITLSDLAGHYAVTKISVYYKSDPPFRVNAGDIGEIQVMIEATGDFTVVPSAATGLRSQTGRITVSGANLIVTTDDTGSVFLHPSLDKFTYRGGVLSLIQDDIPQFVGLDVVLTTVTTELTKE